MRRRLWIKLLGALGLITFLWFFKINGTLSPIQGRPAMAQRSSYPSFTRLDYNPLYIKQGCYGFEGTCHLSDLGIDIKLTFKGVKINKPYYILFNMWGGNTGWQFYKTYFGQRVLTIERASGQVLAQFHQTLWNTAEYGDLGQLVMSGKDAREILVAPAKYGFILQDEEVYSVPY